MEKRGQVGLEYLMIVGISTIAVITLLILSQQYSDGVEDTLNANQVDQVAKQIVDAAESMYYFGEPSKTTIRVFIPEGIEVVNVSSDFINFKVKVGSTVGDLVYDSDVPLAGNISNVYGFHDVSIEARGGQVWLNTT